MNLIEMESYSPYSFVCLASFTHHHICDVHPYYCVSEICSFFVAVYYSLVWLYQQYIYPFSCRWTFGLFLMSTSTALLWIFIDMYFSWVFLGLKIGIGFTLLDTIKLFSKVVVSIYTLTNDISEFQVQYNLWLSDHIHNIQGLAQIMPLFNYKIFYYKIISM